MRSCVKAPLALVLVALLSPGDHALVADSVYCDYDPFRKKANIGSNFLERETF